LGHGHQGESHERVDGVAVKQGGGKTRRFDY